MRLPLFGHALIALAAVTILCLIGWMLTCGELAPTDLSGGKILRVSCAQIDQVRDTIVSIYDAEPNSGHGQQLHAWHLDRQHEDLARLQLNQRVAQCH